MLDKSAVKQLLDARFEKDIHTSLAKLPLPQQMGGAKKAAKIIAHSIKANEKIAIVGDYDCDGVCSTAILDEFFADLGLKDIRVRIPNRFKDGYGLNEQMIDDLDADLIITVDNGITAFEAAKACRDRAIKLVITDHHMPLDELPDANALVNPQCKDNPFPFKEICGAQVAWYLCAALKEELGIKDYNLGKFTDLLALAIIADMMELKDLNRVLVRDGLKRMNNSPRACFRAICALFGKDKFGFDDISFLITPLINSAGRMSDAKVSFDFLRSQDDISANALLEKIQGFNDNRKECEKELFESSSKSVDENDKIIVAWGEKWHEGVIGIVASRLARMYKRPAIVFSIDGHKAKGSARSVGKFDILKLIAAHEKLLISFGGHKGAAGLVIETSKLNEFKQAINSSCVLENFSTNAYEDILGDIIPKEIDKDLMDIIESFQPYGSKNPKPVFWLKGANIAQVSTMGVDGSHLRLSLEAGGRTFDAVNFNYDIKPEPSSKADILFVLSKNTFRGQENLQLIVQEINPN